MAAANREFEVDEGKGKGKMVVEVVKEDESEGEDGGEEVKREEAKMDERPYVEMSLGLGVLEEKGRGGEEDKAGGKGGVEVKGEEGENSDTVGILTKKRSKRKARVEVLGSGKNGLDCCAVYWTQTYGKHI